jgi:hypothetical protein
MARYMSWIITEIPVEEFFGYRGDAVVGIAL